MMLKEGETYRTTSGRETSPAPKIDLTSDRKANATIKRIEQWLIDEAKAEAQSKDDHYNLIFFQRMFAGKLSQGDKDHLNGYLFGEFGD